jgi:hypothetical protein
VNNTAQLAVFAHGTDMEFSVTEELAALMPMKGTTTGADICEDIKKALQNLDIPIQKKLPGAAGGYGAPSRPEGTVACLHLSLSDMEKTTDHNLIICYCLIHQESLWSKSLKVMNVVTLV